VTRLRPQLQDALAAAAAPRVTVVRSGGLGDTLLTLPVVRTLAQDPSGPAVTLAGSAWAEAVLPLLARPLRLLRFDGPEFTSLFLAGASSDPTGAFARAHAAVVFSAARNDVLAENARRLCPGPVVVWPAAPVEGVHAARHYLRAVIEDPPDPVPLPSIRPAPDRLAWAGRWMEAEFGRGPAPLAVHPGSGGHHKCWSSDHFASVAAAVERPVLLVEGPADAEAVASVKSLLPEGLPVAAAPGMPLPALAALLCRCYALVGNDSGVSHLAGMLGVRTVAVFGPTDPAVWRPLGPNVSAIGGRGAWPETAAVLDAVRCAL
jgi:heptosyltransferase-3